MKKLKIFDGCTEFGSETQAFRARGHEVTTLGLEGNVDIKCDIRQYYPSVYDKYDFMWFSPPCQCFSMGAVGKHWNKNHTPKPETIDAISILEACIRIIKTCNPTFWLIENPRAMMRTLDILKEQRRLYFLSTVTLCQYGDTAMKPTDLFHNIYSFHPLRCSPKSKCHIPSPRHSHTTGSTQGKTYEERLKLPYGLSMAICKAIEGELC